MEARPGRLLDRWPRKDQTARDRASTRAWPRPGLAIAARPNAPDGHFWLAANMAGYAQDHGIRGGLKYRGDIRDSLEKTLSLDPAFLQGSADRALGRWYFKVPGLFGGSKKKVGRAPAQGADVQPTQHHLAHLSRRDARGARSQGGSDRGIEEGARSVTGSGLAPEDTEFKQQAKTMLQEWQR